MKKKRILACILILIMCLTACQNEEEKTKEEKPTSEQTTAEDANVFKMDREVRTGFMKEKEETGSENFSPVRTVKDLKKMGEKNESSYILMCDLDMSAEEWESISFFGVFEGNHHVISGLKKPLFKGLGGDVRNLGLENAAIENDKNENGAVLASGMSRGTVSNCYATGKIKVTRRAEKTGGLIAKLETGKNSSADIEYCYSNVEIDGTEGRYTGGIVGSILGNTGPFNIIIHDCENYGAVRGKEHVGGIVGDINRRGLYSGYYDNSKVSFQIRNCSNYGSVTAEYTSSLYVGGILGELDAINATGDYENTYEIANCANYGSIVSEAGEEFEHRCAGICGKISIEDGGKISHAIRAEVKNCLNAGEIKHGNSSSLQHGIVGDAKIKYGICNISYCLAINDKASINGEYSTSSSDNYEYNVEECYTTKNLSIAEMKNMTKNLPKFDYPAVWGITKLYNGFPHPYTEDEQEEVNKYYDEKQKEKTEEEKANATADDVIEKQHYHDMLERMNCVGAWPEEESQENSKEFLLSYSDSLQAYYDLRDVNEDGRMELLVKALSNYRIYSYDEKTFAPKVLYSVTSEEKWNSDYGNKIKPEWTLMKPENYNVYRDVYVSTYRDLLYKDLANDLGILFIDNKGDTDKLKKELVSRYSAEFKETESGLSAEGMLNGAKVFELYFVDGGGLSYAKAEEGITLFGVKPGISEDELIKTISKYGFYKGAYNYKMGEYVLSYNVENGVVKYIDIHRGSEYTG